MQEELFKLSGYYIAEKEEIKKHSKGYMSRIFLKYDDLASLDGLYRAQETVRDITDKMKENLTKGMENRSNLMVKNLKMNELNNFPLY